jgi:SAM-dependent methyltransferase
MLIETTDLSLPDFRFDPFIGNSPRDRFRDALDTFIRRPLFKVIYRNKFAHLPYPINLVLPEKGMSTLARRRWVDQHIPLKNSRLMVIGCGDGWDFGSYLRFQPREIVGVDLYSFSARWQQIQAYVKQAKLPTKVDFLQADIADLSPEKMGQFDIICSDAVFEHCQDLESVLRKLYSLLRSQGIMYASYGPLWHSWGGDHFSGRGGLDQGFNHLLLEPAAYENYFQAHLEDEASELQNGGRYVKLDLFSKLSSQQYVDLYKKVGFQVKSLVLEFSSRTEELNQLSPAIFDRLLEKYPQLNIDDFSIKVHLVLLQKP